jgi:hypothetical protein
MNGDELGGFCAETVETICLGIKAAVDIHSGKIISTTWLPSNVNEHFDNVAQAAPQSSIADGIAAAFRSDQTPLSGKCSVAYLPSPSANRKLAFLVQAH